MQEEAVIPIIQCYGIAAGLVLALLLLLWFIPEREPPPPSSSMGE